MPIHRFTKLVESQSGKLVIIWLATSMLILITAWPNILNWRVGDPDDQLRILQVRDWLNGQSWFDTTQYRMNPPAGAPMHWSRLADIPLAIVIKVTQIFANQSDAEKFAAVVVPMMTYGIVILLVAKISKQLNGPRIALLTAGILATSITVLAQLRPLRIDHHGWQMILFLICFQASLFPKQDRLRSVITGAALAIWFNISSEAVPFIILFTGLSAVRWIFSKNDTDNTRTNLIIVTAALAALSAILLILTKGLPNSFTYCDAVSPVQVGAILVTSISLLPITSITDNIQKNHYNFSTPIIRALSLVLASIFGILLILFLSPDCITGGAFGSLDPLVRKFWYNRGFEGLSINYQSTSTISQTISTIIILIIGVSFHFFSNKPSNQKLNIILVAIFCVAISLFIARTVYYASLLSLIFIAPVLAKAWDRSKSSSLIKKTTLILIIFLLLFPGPTYSVISRNLISAEGNINYEKITKAALKCEKRSSITALNTLPTAQFMAPLDISPTILLHTNHRAIASGHHRNAEAMKDVITTFISTPKEAAKILDDRQVDFIALCPGSIEVYYYRNYAPTGLAENLLSGNIPDWLTEEDIQGPVKVWHVDKEKLRHALLTN